MRKSLIISILLVQSIVYHGTLNCVQWFAILCTTEQRTSYGRCDEKEKLLECRENSYFCIEKMVFCVVFEKKRPILSVVSHINAETRDILIQRFVKNRAKM